MLRDRSAQFAPWWLGKVFIRTFPDFNTGFDELIRTCRPVIDTWNDAKLQHISGQMAYHMSKQTLVQFLLSNNAVKARGFQRSHILGSYAYYCPSGLAFGWHQLEGGRFNFFIRTDTFKIGIFRKTLEPMLYSTGWLKFTLADSAQCIGKVLIS
jgi:hypothetical protein